MQKIIIHTFYFGSTPWYLNYFLQSCLHNKDVDFIFFTDIKEINNDASNIKIVQISFNEFSTIIDDFFDFKIKITKPIKLCDIRPSFGEVFQDLFKGYAFWGYCDIDIIFGRIRSFLNSDVLIKYDIIFSKNEYPSGFFAIYRNNDEINQLYRSSPDYVKVFQSKELLLFDECGGHYDEIFAGINILETQYEIDSMHHILERNKEKFKMLFEWYSLEASPGKIRFDNGLLSYANKVEILLYHLTNFKVNYYFNETRTRKVISNKYYIDKYLIVNDNWLMIFLSNLYCSIKPFVKEKLMKCDVFLTSKIFKNQYAETLKKGKYRYMKRELSIAFHNNKYYLLRPNGILSEITFLNMFKTIFYEKKTKLFYLMDGFNDGRYNSFYAIFENGGVMKYRFVE